MNNLLNLIQHGQSYWLDNLTREKINNGELKKRVNEEGLRGVTTNPSIFNKAISNSNEYDSQIRLLFNQRKQVNEVYEELAVKDVQDACDILRPVFDKSGGVDGFVSLEVSPHLAFDAKTTMAEARRLFKKVDRLNSFIKIPATTEGITAIEEMLYEGININVTLIFSVTAYKMVAEAYINALDRRAAENKPISHIRSVASFFLSRIDVLVDEMLTQSVVPDPLPYELPLPGELKGKAAVANAKLAYKEFNKLFSGERWNKLTTKGAHVQRPLWASTGTKNPDYSDVKYVEPLIGSNTVNTMPDETIAFFSDHGVIYPDSIQLGLKAAELDINNLKKYNIDIQNISKELLSDGIKKFQGDYDKLFNNLLEKKDKI